jgi:hypothetical protein
MSRLQSSGGLVGPPDPFRFACVQAQPSTALGHPLSDRIDRLIAKLLTSRLIDTRMQDGILSYCS